MCAGLSSDTQYVTNQTLATVSRQLSALGLLTSKGVVLYNKQQTAAGIGLKRETIKMDAWTHVQACVCVQRESCPAGSGSIDGHLSSGLHLGGGSPPVPPQAQLSRSADYPYSSPGINARGCKQSSTEPESLKDFFLGPPTSSTLQIS